MELNHLLRSHALARYVLLLLLSSLISCAAPPSVPKPDEQQVVVGTQLLQAETVSAPGQSAISENQAVSLASASVPTSRTASAIDAHFVSITLRKSDGEVAMGIASHPVWLVTFRGALYDPASALEGSCACGDSYKRPSTTVALDAQTGLVVIIYGGS